MPKHLTISGRVQGVGFRYEMTRQADRLGVTGWVRNRRDGTVEALVDGSPEAIESIVAWAGRGPPGARVTGVEVQDAQGSYGTFEQWPTG